MKLDYNYVCKTTPDKQFESLYESISLVYKYMIDFHEGKKPNLRTIQKPLLLLQYFFKGNLNQLDLINGVIQLFNSQNIVLQKAISDILSLKKVDELHSLEDSENYLTLFAALAEAYTLLGSRYESIKEEIDVFELDFDSLMKNASYPSKIIVMDTNILVEFYKLIPPKYYKSGKYTIKHTYEIHICKNSRNERNNQTHLPSLYPTSLLRKLRANEFSMTPVQSEINTVLSYWRNTNKAKRLLGQKGDDALIEFAKSVDMQILTYTFRLAQSKKIFLFTNDREMQDIVPQFFYETNLKVICLHHEKIIPVRYSKNIFR